MSDDAQTPAARDPWAAPSEAGSRDAAPKVPLAKPDSPAAPAPEPNPGSSPAPDGQAGPGHTVAGQGAGYTVAGHGPGEGADEPGPATPPRPSVHDQLTVTSMPGIDDTPPHPRPWATPFTPQGPTPPTGGPANPFAPPGATPSMGGPVNPFAPPGPAAHASGSAAPFAPHAHGEPIPPPPIAPEGPGQVPYGYGYPPQAGYGGPGYYNWPGMTPMPRNGMGTAALVLGIIAVVVFCLWPIAVVLGVLAVIFGVISRGKARHGESTNPGQALAGIICGAVGIVLGAVMIAATIAHL